MGLLSLHTSSKYFRVKHSFNADDAAERLLQLADRALRDKTEFINRCINYAGPMILKTIHTERSEAVASAMKEIYKPKPK